MTDPRHADTAASRPALKDNSVTIRLSSLFTLAFAILTSACSLPAFADDQTTAKTESEPRGVLLAEPIPAPDFTLTDHRGESFTRSSLDGKVVAVFFGFTGCPDICPLTLSFMAHATTENEQQRDDLAFLFVTVDPERDTPERLAMYVERVDAPVVGLTGAPETLAAVWNDYDITVERHDRPDGNYLIDHSAQVWLIDRDGKIRGFLPMGADGDDLAHDLGWLLEEGY